MIHETWIHHYMPETKQQSKQCVLSCESASKKSQVDLSANVVMATIFWDARGVIHIDYLQKGTTINGEYYTNLLDRFNEDLKKKRPHLAKKKVIFHQGNARVHTCVVSMAKFHELRYELLPHQPYSTDLATSDYFWSRTLRTGLAERDFIPTMKSSHKQRHILRTSRYLIFLEGIQNLENRWTKCISLKSDYIEK